MARQVQWERLEQLSRPDLVLTGDVEEGDEEPATPTGVTERRRDPLLARPLLVYVHTDPDACDGECLGACQRYFDAEAQVFSKEKVALGARAFRRVWMTPEDADREPLLAAADVDRVPRVVLLDIAREESAVLHGRGISARRVYAEMRKVAGRFYEERLDALVKEHLRVVAEQDKLAREEWRLAEQASLTDDDRRAERLREDLDAVREGLRALEREVEDLWDLTMRPL